MLIITALQFIQKWKPSKLKERAAAQEHFIDLCHLLGHDTPAKADPEGEWFTFEYGAQKTTGSNLVCPSLSWPFKAHILC